MLDRITPLILTYNESANIERTLSMLGAVRRVIVIDSRSDDGTREIIARHGNAEVIVRPFDTHANQWNFGLAQVGPDSEWVLALDADYLLSDEIVVELGNLVPPDDVAGYRARFRYCIHGKPIRSGTYPPVVVLFRRNLARFIQDGHTQRVVVDGRLEELSGVILHDDRKSLSRWLDSQKLYVRLEAEYLQRADRSQLGWQDRIRLMIGVAPLLVFIYLMCVRGGVLDGWHGLYYALQRAYAELLLSLELLERRLRRLSGD